MVLSFWQNNGILLLAEHFCFAKNIPTQNPHKYITAAYRLGFLGRDDLLSSLSFVCLLHGVVLEYAVSSRHAVSRLLSFLSIICLLDAEHSNK